MSNHSADDVLSRGVLADPRLSAMLADTPRLAGLDLDGFDAIVVCGRRRRTSSRDDEDL